MVVNFEVEEEKNYLHYPRATYSDVPSNKSDEYTGAFGSPGNCCHMIQILDGNSERVLHVCRKIVIFLKIFD